MGIEEKIVVTGMVIRLAPSGEADRRISILTSDRGKITAFARGAKKPNSRFAATTDSFVFGKFTLLPGRDAYSLVDAEISNYFEKLRTDILLSCYASYFGEIADYYSRENTDEKAMLGLLYQSLRAICETNLSPILIRSVYEIKSLMINGEFPGIPVSFIPSDTLRYTIEYIANHPVQTLYSFTLEDEPLLELQKVSSMICEKAFDRHFRSLEILNTLC